MVRRRHMKLCPVCNTIHDSASWEALPLVVKQDCGVEVLELRNCPCGNTLAIELPVAFVLKYAEGREEYADADEAAERMTYLAGDCIMSREVGELAWCGCAPFGAFVSVCEGCS